jgi:predicted DNA-binding transcriptional regulator YafY
MSESSFARLLRLLQLIPGAPRTIDTTSLAQQLSSEGFETTARTVQRDLVKLETMGYGLECLDDSKPFRWRYGAAAKPMLMPGLDLPQALALLTVEAHMQHLLPRTVLLALRAHFDTARTVVDGKPARRWLEKVRVVNRAQPVSTPRIDVEVADAVQVGLFEERVLEVRYRRADATVGELTLHPLGLIVRDAVSYLVAIAFDYDDVRLYALHRMSRVKVGGARARKAPPGFDLDGFVESGELGWKLSSSPIAVELRFFGTAGRTVVESPLSADQQVVVDGDVVTVKATVADTRVLRSWLLSFGAGVEVRKPAALRRDLGGALRAALARYDA